MLARRCLGAAQTACEAGVVQGQLMMALLPWFARFPRGCVVAL